MQQQTLFGDNDDEAQCQAAALPTDYSPQFETFWSVCPRNRRVGKKAAWRAWSKAIETTTPEAITEAMRRFAASKDVQESEAKHIPHPATWLNGRRFEDEVEAPDDEPEELAYIQTDPIQRPQHREKVPISQLDTVRTRAARQIFAHLRVCSKPFCEACESRNVRVYRALFLSRYGIEKCDFGPPPGQRGEKAIRESEATERRWEELRRRNPGMSRPRLYPTD